MKTTPESQLPRSFGISKTYWPTSMALPSGATGYGCMAMLGDDSDPLDNEMNDILIPVSRVRSSSGTNPAVVPRRVEAAAFESGEIKCTSDLVRFVKAEMDRGDYDKMLVFAHLRHFEIGSEDFKKAYLDIRLKSLGKCLEVIQTKNADLSSKMVVPTAVRWDFWHCEVKQLVDLVTLAGVWVALIVLGQLAAAFYLARFIVPYFDLDASLLIVGGVLSAVYLALDAGAYLRLRGQMISKWVGPAFCLASAAIAPGGALYLVLHFQRFLSI